MLQKIKKHFSQLNEKYGNYIPADLWAFLIFIIVTIIGLLIFL